MAFGQQSGPPASASQLKELLQLLDGAGHGGFRDARHSLGFSQRQAGGRFTRDEAASFIDHLQGAADAGDEVGGEVPPVKLSANEVLVRGMKDQVLASELERRGWIVIAP